MLTFKSPPFRLTCKSCSRKKRQYLNDEDDLSIYLFTQIETDRIEHYGEDLMPILSKALLIPFKQFVHTLVNLNLVSPSERMQLAHVDELAHGAVGL